MGFGRSHKVVGEGDGREAGRWLGTSFVVGRARYGVTSGGLLRRCPTKKYSTGLSPANPVERFSVVCCRYLSLVSAVLAFEVGKRGVEKKGNAW